MYHNSLYIDAWNISEQDKSDMKADFNLWLKNQHVNEIEYYNGELYFIVDNDDIVCKSCMKDNPEWIDNISIAAVNMESDIKCDHCYGDIAALYGDD